MSLVGLRQRAPWLALAAIFLLTAGGAVLLAQKPRIEKIRILGGERPQLGITMEDVTAENMATYQLSAERGVIVRSIEKGSPAEQAGVQEKDVILEFAGTPVLSTAQLARLVEETPVGRKVDLIVSRAGKTVPLTAKIGRREGEVRIGEGMRSIWIPKPGVEDFLQFRGPGGKFFRFQGPESEPFTFSLPGKGFAFALEGKLRLGLSLQPLTEQLADHLGVPGKKGVLVTSVSAGSPAASANIKAGDVIVKADESVVEDPEDLRRVVQGKDPGGKIDLRIIRDRKEMSITVELAKDDKKPGGYRL